MTTSNRGMAIMPESLYKRRKLRLRDIREGDIIPVTVIDYCWDEGKIYCEISDRVKRAFIREENFEFPTLPTDFEEADTPPTITAHIGRQVVAKVVAKNNNGFVELDRKSVMENTISYLSHRALEGVGNVVTATIDSIRSYGAFVDIGNGVESLLHISEFSVCHYDHLSSLFKIGEQIEVKLLDFDENTNRFKVSRKQAYERAILPRSSIQRVRVLMSLPGGAFVEYNPATSGIMDIKGAQNLFGKYAMCYIKCNKPKGFKANFVSSAKK